MEPKLIGQFEEGQGIDLPHSSGTRNGTIQRALPAWLPAPPAAKAARPRNPRKATSTRDVWIRSEGELLTERLMLALLVLSAVIAIGYGFGCLVDLVQNWAGFNSAVEHLIH
jgi:hypothetical protein